MMTMMMMYAESLINITLKGDNDDNDDDMMMITNSHVIGMMRMTLRMNLRIHQC